MGSFPATAGQKKKTSVLEFCFGFSALKLFQILKEFLVFLYFRHTTELHDRVVAVTSAAGFLWAVLTILCVKEHKNIPFPRLTFFFSNLNEAGW